MVQKEITFKDGTRIFYEKKDGSVQRFIEYALSPMQKKIIKEKPILKSYYESEDRKCNAGKYYYLNTLYCIACKLDDIHKIQLHNELKSLHDRTNGYYDSNIINKNFLDTFGKYWPHNEHQCASFFTTIYLAMVDLEDGKRNHPHSMGKTMVLKSCEAVILKGIDPKEAATMYERKHNDVTDNDINGYYNVDDSLYEKYHSYNGYDDDTIDEAFDGFPEATWNVD